MTTESVEADLRRDRAWSATVDRIWPALAAPALVRRLLTNRAALASAAGGLLSADEQAAIRRPSTRRVADEPWTSADLALLDEAEAAISGPPRAYGHIVVDEAQDLSTMELRAVARRSPEASMTVLGDLAQATAPAAQQSWESAVAALGGPATAERADLDLGYRVPASVMDVANGLLAEAAPDVVPTRSVRAGGRPPTAVEVAGADGLVDAVVAAVGELAESYSSVAVVVPDEAAASMATALASDGRGGAQPRDHARPAVGQGPRVRRRRRGRAGGDLGRDGAWPPAALRGAHPSGAGVGGGAPPAPPRRARHGVLALIGGTAPPPSS